MRFPSFSASYAGSHKGWALGSERFKEQIESLAKRRATSKGLGRPRKENKALCRFEWKES